MAQRILKQIRTLPTVEAECHLIQVRGQMLDGDAMPRSHDAALEQGECRLYRVRVNVAANVLALFVIHRLVLVLERAPHRVLVRSVFVRDEHFDFFANVIVDHLVKSFRFQIVGANESQIAAALPDADDDFFVAGVSRAGAASAPSPADIRFVNFDRASQHRLLDFFHRSTNSVTQIPRGLVAPADHALDLIRAHSLARFADQIRNEKPLRQGQVGVIEDRSSFNRELVTAVIAIVLAALHYLRHRLALAARTGDTFGPAQSFQILAALVLTSELVHYSKQGGINHGIS